MSYVVVGCTECAALWIITGSNETSECPRCGKRHQVDQLRHLAEADDKAHASELRARLLAQRQDATDAFDAVPHFERLEADLDHAGVDDREYLAASGIDPDAVEKAGSQAPTSMSREEIIQTAIDNLESPTETAIIEYAQDRDVSPDYVRKALRKLTERGELIKTNNGYRRV